MNIINALINLVSNPVTQLVEYYQGRNRANNAGDALEEYIKDLFAGTFDTEPNERRKKQEEIFSYLGNNSNPPDAMLKGGDAIEVKKIESDNASLALNSSYPKHELYRSDPMISKKCRDAEDGKWDKKDILYVVGVIDKNTDKLKHLCMVYGTEYCASAECYNRIKESIKTGVESTEGIEFKKSKELGHINKVDHLGVTYMRIRGMWGIENPWRVFQYIYQRDASREFNFMCIISNKKWGTLDNRDELLELSKENDALKVIDTQVNDPDDPSKMIDVKLITFHI